jgi:hypothetical protein
MPSYKIIAAMKTGTYQGAHGEMYKYTVQLEGEADTVEVSQKPDTPAPQPGETLEGSIESTQYGKRFKKEFKGGTGFSGGRVNSPEDRASIERQVSLKAAVETVRDFHTFTNESKFTDLADYRDEIIITAKAFAAALGNANPQTTVASPPAQPMTKQEVDDLPPVDNYDQPPF